MPSLGVLSTTLTLDNRGLESGAKQSRSTLKSLGGGLADVTKKTAALGVSLGAAGGALIAGLTVKGLKAVDSQAKLAKAIGGTNDSLRALQIVAEDSGLDGFEKSVNRLNRRLGAVEAGGGPAVETLDRLNLSAEELSQLDADDRVAAIADAIKDSGMSAQESARYLQQLGFEQANANEFFRQGGDAIRDARGEVDEYGLALSEVDSTQVERANDAFSRVGRVIEVIQQRLAVQLAPYIEFVADLINDAAKESGGFRDQIDGAIRTGIRMGAKLADIVEGVRRAFLLAGQGSAVAALAITQGFMEAGNAIMAGPVNAVNSLIKLYNKIPGLPKIEEFMQPDIVRDTQSKINIMKEAVEIGKEEMKATLMEPMPSAGLEKKLEQIRIKSRETAEQVVADREKMQAPETGGIGGGSGDQAAERRAQLAKTLEAVQQATADQLAEEESRYRQSMEGLKEALSNQLITEQEYARQSEEAAKAHQQTLISIEESGAKDRQEAIESFTSTLPDGSKASDALKQNLDRRLSMVKSSAEEERAAQQKKYAQELEILESSGSDSAAAQEQINRQKEALELAHQERMKAISLEAIQERQAAIQAFQVEASGGGGEGEKDELHRQELERRLERIRESVMTEQEILKNKHEQELEELEAFREADLLMEGEYKTLKEELEEQHQERLTKLAESGEKDRNDAVERFAKANVAIRENSVRAEAAALRSGLQTMFGDAKVASGAMAALQKFEAIASAYSWGAAFGGPPAGAAAAATAAYAQQQNMDAISSQSFSGGTANVGGVEDSSSSGQQIQEETQRNVSLDLSLVGGNERDSAVVGSFIEQINDEIERGGRISRVGLA